MTVITISREPGSGSNDIANLVANRLGIRVVDREIIQRAAARAGVTERTIEELDETRPSFIKQMLDLMGKYGDQGIYTEWGGPATIYVPPPMNLPILDTDTYRLIVEEVIRSIAAEQSAVILGRAGQIILRDLPDALHVRIVADLEHRVKWVMEHQNLDRCASLKLIKDTDRRRADYLKSYYKAEWTDPQLYDLVLNTSRLGVENCADIILHAVTQKSKVAAG